MKGPFLDPLNKQGRHANSILEVVAGVLRKDPTYVARLVTHYQIAKDISSGKLKPEDATSSYRIPEFVGVDISQPPSSVGEHPVLKEKSVGKPESGDVFSKFFKMGWLAGSDMTLQEGSEEFVRKFPGTSANLDSPWEKTEFFGGGFNTSGRAERDAKKRQRQAKKRNRR